MDPRLIQQTISTPATIPSEEPRLLTQEPEPTYLSRLFKGRMNRQNYIVGSTFFVLVPLICFIVVLFNILLSPNTFAMPYLNPSNPAQIITPHVSIMSLLNTPANILWVSIGILFTLLSTPYLLSMQIKRLHDLNLNGWLWLINFVPFTSLFALPLPGANTGQTEFLIANGISLAASIFSTYVTLAPGTNGPNKYGEKPLPRSSFLKDILAL